MDLYRLALAQFACELNQGSIALQLEFLCICVCGNAFGLQVWVQSFQAHRRSRRAFGYWALVQRSHVNRECGCAQREREREGERVLCVLYVNVIRMSH